MKTLGIITAGAAAAVAVVAVTVGIKSIPDIRRYLRIRSM
ncbi:hypothetical protein GCM10015535_34470 [Streptomyces gelaticus]|uniref:Uncharacterized protein n=1 Tax=Streptomyces gelaticus TaxID=285446 RepID=A0ABQ2VZC1_9ACTN|nr:hypothetical protein GCM10015535_34470 [Streptomyces gelaticus]